MKEGTFGVIFAPPKMGKTSLVTAAFPGPNVLYIGHRSPITKTAKANYGYEPMVWGDTTDVSAVQSLLDLNETLGDILASGRLTGDPEVARKEGCYLAIIVDDITLLCQTNLNYWLDNTPVNDSGTPNFGWPYQQGNKHIQMLSEICRNITDLGAHVWLTAHEVYGKLDKKSGEFTPGGPLFVNRKQAVRVPGWFDFIGRVIDAPNYPDPCQPRSFKRNIWVDEDDTDWVTGDRDTIGHANTPPSIRAMMIQAGYKLPRLGYLDWQDDLMYSIAEVVMSDTSKQAITNLWLATLTKAANIIPKKLRKDKTRRELLLYLRWAFQEGLALGLLRHREQNVLLPKAFTL